MLKMSQTVLFIKLLLVVHAAQSDSRIKEDCNTNVTLPCPGINSNRMDFLSLAWYKHIDQKKRGIIRIGQGDVAPQIYNFFRPADLGDKHSLFLPDVKPEDSGRYECAIHANVGQKNKFHFIDLTVDECVTEAALTTTELPVMTNTMNSSFSSLPCHQVAQDIPVLWSICGYGAVAVIKITLCLISLKVIHIRSSRRWQNKRRF